MYGIYANIGGILMINVTIYSSTMDPVGIKIDNDEHLAKACMGSGCFWIFSPLRETQLKACGGDLR